MRKKFTNLTVKMVAQVLDNFDSIKSNTRSLHLEWNSRRTKRIINFFKVLLLIPQLSRFIQRLLTNFSFYAILWQFVLYVPISSHLVNVWECEKEKNILFLLFARFLCINPIQEKSFISHSARHTKYLNLWAVKFA